MDIVLLNRLEEVIEELKSTSKITEKKKILSKYPDLKEILFYVYNPRFMFHLTSKNIIKHRKLSNELDNCDFVLKKLLDNLKDCVWSGHEGIRKVLCYIAKYGHEELIFNIIDRDLKIRMGQTQVNSVFPKLIPTFNVTLAETFDKQNKYFDTGGNWFISRKLDGVRCLCIINIKSQTVTFYYREGNQFTTLGKIEEDIKKNILPHLKADVVIDGEVCLIENEKESFSEIMKMIKKINFTIPNPKYIIFDLLTLSEFENEMSENRILSDRLKLCNKIIKKAGSMKTISLLNQSLYTIDIFNEMINSVEQEGWEGLMLRKDVDYEGKRTKNLLKLKNFQREEYKVIGIVVGKISNNGGIYSNEDCLKSATIKHKNCIVEVGSGFSDKEKIYYYKNQHELIGKVISVQYFEETITRKKDTNIYSLRFPTFKGIHGIKRTI